MQPAQLTLDGSLCFSEVAIHRRAVKRLSLRVRDDGTVEMVGPKRLSLAEFERFYRSKQRWVENQRAAALAMQASKPRLSGDEFLLHDEIMRRCDAALPEGDKPEVYRRYARSYLTRRLDELSKATGLHYTRLTVRAQRTRWGSCSSKQAISLNWRLVQMPAFVSDYVIIHELCHTRHMNHGPAFWQLVAKHCKCVDEARRWLRQHGSGLPD